jgi:chromosome segregation ATPase
MAWEVRRLEKISSETQARFNRQSRHVDQNKDREAKLLKQMGDLEVEAEQRLTRIQQLDGELHLRGAKEKELEEMVVELGRRERGVEEELRAMEKQKRSLEAEKEGWESQRRAVERDGGAFEAEKREWAKEREEWASHKRLLAEEMERLVKDRQKMLDAGKTSERDRAIMEGLKFRLGEVLGRSAVGDHELEGALREVGTLVQRREKEVMGLKDEMKEVNMGLEEELRRVSAERDSWKVKAEKVEQGYKGDLSVIERRARVSPSSVKANIRVKQNKYQTLHSVTKL